MESKEIKELQKEMKSLGILNIEADGDLSIGLLRDAIDAVKETNLNFKELAEKSKQFSAAATR
ncbi:hypothetical protein HRQ91_03245 [Treponema parvum]|uniref:Uncharacterized protein n=1 Tax=Treponema parvum TaxID=138851 RepID=A0A975F3A7_9SPIR|nr:hypothetical protein [Treponema parvum]QTQ13551.1 hypothetical protein HRQ91_03245 [Treponema parvum]